MNIQKFIDNHCNNKYNPDCDNKDITEFVSNVLHGFLCVGVDDYGLLDDDLHFAQEMLDCLIESQNLNKEALNDFFVLWMEQVYPVLNETDKSKEILKYNVMWGWYGYLYNWIEKGVTVPDFVHTFIHEREEWQKNYVSEDDE